MKAKDTDILILMIYAYAVQQPEHDWHMQTDKDYLISIKKMYGKLGSTTVVSKVVIRLVAILMFQNEQYLNEYHQVLCLLI